MSTLKFWIFTENFKKKQKLNLEKGVINRIKISKETFFNFETFNIITWSAKDPLDTFFYVFSTIVVYDCSILFSYPKLIGAIEFIKKKLIL